MKGFANHPYIPNSVPEVQEEMLKEIGMTSLDELHKNVPEQAAGSTMFRLSAMRSMERASF